MGESLDKVIIPADMIEAAEMLPHAQRVEYLAALVEYAFAQREPKLTGAAAALFHTSRGRLDLSRERLLNGKKGGQKSASKTQANPQANSKQTPKQTPSKLEANGQANSKQTRPNGSDLLGGVRVGVGVRVEEPSSLEIDNSSSRRTPPPPTCEDEARADKSLYQPVSSYPDGTGARANSSRKLGEFFEGGVV